MVEEVYARLLQDLEHALAGDLPVEQRILQLYARVGLVSDLEIMTLRLILQEMLVSPPRRARLLERFQRGHLGLVRGALMEGVKQGRVRGDRSAAVLLLCTLAVGAVPQFVLRALGAQGPFGEYPKGPALAKELLDVLLHGIGSPHSSHGARRERQVRA